MILQPNNPTHPAHCSTLDQRKLQSGSEKSICSCEFCLAIRPILRTKHGCLYSSQHTPISRRDLLQMLSRREYDRCSHSNHRASCETTDPTECSCSCSEVVKKEAVVCLVMSFKAGDSAVNIQLTT